MAGAKRTRLKALIVVIGLAVAHLMLCKAIVALTLLDPFGISVPGSSPGLGTHILVNATRVLYFPIVTLSLYSRQLFPGNLIYIPIFANSLFWGVGLYLALRIKRFIACRRSTGI